jgi:hypothetical protein
MFKRILNNPNFIYICAFIVPFLFYSLEWSALYPRLSAELFAFYLFTFAVCILIGVAIMLRKPFHYTAIRETSGNITIAIAMYMMYALEVLYSRYIPLFALLRGDFNYSEDTFGVPVIHTFLVSFNTFFAIFVFHQYISTKKLRLLVLFFVVLLPFILLVYRSSILNILLGSLVVFMLGRATISYKLVLKTIAGVMVVFFLFGFMGNLRSGHGDSTYIPRMSAATEEFLSSSIPKEFYWSYLYVASPVANLQNNINYVKKPEGTYRDLIVNECLPSFLTKFIIGQEEKSFHQINPWLNVGTIYVYSFSYLRWQGILTMFFYFIGIVNVYYLLLQKSETYKVTGMAILFNTIIFANFHNTISYSAGSIQLIYPIIFSMATYLINKRKQKPASSNEPVNTGN